MESFDVWCFICGRKIDVDARSSTSLAGDDLAKLKEALVILSGLSKVPNVQPSHWDFLESEKCGSICCEICLGILRDLEGLHEMLEKTKKSLWSCVEHLESLIVASIHTEKILEQGDNQIWAGSCVRLRNHVINKHKEPVINIKEERDTSCLEIDDLDHFEDVDTNEAPSTPLDFGNEIEVDDNNEGLVSTSLIVEAEHEKTPSTETVPRRSARIHKLQPCSVVVEKLAIDYPEWTSVAFDNVRDSKPTKRGRKQKGEVKVEVSKKETHEAEDSEWDENEVVSNFEERDSSDFEFDTEKTPTRKRKAAKISNSTKGQKVKKKRTSQGRHQCPYENCDLQFNSTRTLQTHIDHHKERESRPDITTCEICGARILQKGLNSHVALKHGVKASELRREEEKQTENQTQSAEGKSESQSERPSTSKRKPNRKNKDQRPPFLPFVVVEENLFLFRWGTFVTLEPYQSVTCKAHNCDFKAHWNSDPYNAFQKIRGHILDSHRNAKHRQRVPHPCLICNEVFTNQEEFRKHVKTHKDMDPSSWTQGLCDICMKVGSLLTLQSHMFSHKNAEERAAAIAANDYSKRCLRPKESEITEKKYVCRYPGCGSAHKSTGNLKRHERTHQAREERTDLLTCEECGEQIFKDSIKEHMERIHHPESVDNVLTCPVCSKKFHGKDRSLLKIHIRRHTGETPFLCSECGKSFVSLNVLRNHVNVVHRPEQILQCEWCDVKYTKYFSFRKHVQKKHPEHVKRNPSKRKRSKFYCPEGDNKPAFIGPIQQYPCSICEVHCKYRTTLKKHMQRFHGATPKVSRKALAAGGGGFKSSRNDPFPQLQPEASDSSSSYNNTLQDEDVEAKPNFVQLFSM